MATADLIGAPTRIRTTPVPTPNSHYAAARRAENAARSLSVRFSVRSFTGQFAGDASPEDRAELAAARDSFYLLAAAHRQAAHRMERGQRTRYRFSVLLWPATRIANKIRRFRNERRTVTS